MYHLSFHTKMWLPGVQTVVFPLLPLLSRHNKCSLTFVVYYIRESRSCVIGGLEWERDLVLTVYTTYPRAEKLLLASFPISPPCILTSDHLSLLCFEHTGMSSEGHNLLTLFLLPLAAFSALPLNSHSSSLNHWLHPFSCKYTYFFLWISLGLFFSNT